MRLRNLFLTVAVVTVSHGGAEAAPRSHSFCEVYAEAKNDFLLLTGPQNRSVTYTWQQAGLNKTEGLIIEKGRSGFVLFSPERLAYVIEQIGEADFQERIQQHFPGAAADINAALARPLDRILAAQAAYPNDCGPV